ncbi:TIGR04282 family arsenosugar biosynthesis glycosyltransferase [Shimia thalassica]|uniref:TIGR04282 family arsenosugar biosynthesis glycosyltransferase n=1 Tax=Shimia thalassica TaxID=1715693 RepID=UPI002733D7C1|nr:TIGR04282 family arsenosugar biosynthesis glycosyltransferase [Shimia thalassica]MDP2519866.1 TIGR04282 family arsenosugar biosynthesis glycosyltransferase [Shimia thalassica]
MSYRPRLVVMIKVPRPGRVKTRLGRDIGMTAAAWWFRHQSQSLIRRLTNPRWDLILAVAPDHAGMNSRIWSPDIPRIPQGSGDLGDRMSRIFRELPPGPVCIIGADIPGIQTSHIAEAFQALGDNDAVFGPAFDGGYWLTGLKRAAPVRATLFDNVRWSTEHALTDSIETLRGQRIALISKLRDVDTVADLPFA